MDNKKSTGCDGISAKLLKIALPYIAETLTNSYNLCIQKNVFPTAFKRAKVIPFPNTKPISTDLNDYRCTSILSALTKPLERDIHKHLTYILETHQRFHSFQSGFRCEHSCQIVVIRLIIIIMEICKAPTLRVKALNKHTHIMYIEMENVIKNI